MNNTFILQRFDSGMHYILLNESDISALINQSNNRVICTLNEKVHFHCAILPKKEGGYFINIGSTICKQLKLKTGSLVTVNFAIDDSPYQFEMPVELKEVLESDSIANALFHALTEGNQRGLMYLVSQAKSVDKRIERALTIAEKVKIGITSPKLVLKK